VSAVAGMIDLTGRRPVPVARLEEMVQAMSHRGPDEQDLWHEPGIGIGLRRLQVGNSDRRRPMGHPQNRSIVALDGTLFNKEQISSRLQSQGHTPNSGGDDELLQHLWEAKGEKLLDMIEGQFAFALWNRRERRLILARDRFGIRPLHWAQNDGWLLFASEIKGLLASGVVEPRADLRGLSQVFTFFGLPGPVTCFQGISAIIPGRFIDVRAPAVSWLVTVTCSTVKPY